MTPIQIASPSSSADTCHLRVGQELELFQPEQHFLHGPGLSGTARQPWGIFGLSRRVAPKINSYGALLHHRS